MKSDQDFCSLPEPRFHGAAVLAVLCALLGITIVRNALWRYDIPLWEDAAARSPGKARVHYNLGKAYQDREMIGPAIDRYLTTLRLQPAYADAHYNLGNIYHYLQRSDEAILAFENALRFDPGRSYARFVLGDLYASQGRLDEAAAQYRHALKVKPSSPYIHNSLGLVYLRQDRIADAIREFQAALAASPQDRLAAGNLDAARKELQKKTGRRPY